MERHILRERTSSSHIFFLEPVGANACTPLQARQRRPDRLRLARSTAILYLCLNLTTCFSSRGLLPVTHLLYRRALTCCYVSVYSSQRDSLSKHTGSPGTNRKSMSYNNISLNLPNEISFHTTYHMIPNDFRSVPVMELY